ncbi:hypothetical protein E2562_007412 [Oryza meyeriana var. granulata]|uniref:Uncharacterized protein n=1 Tax=Oryza meyeriana var. granulata TaxID=110450 RepID=A0A6G1CZR9_9ORYZ|nr:hypothetical protein E2562_007412 [Oryza meyeriana var. granulata]
MMIPAQSEGDMSRRGGLSLFSMANWYSGPITGAVRSPARSRLSLPTARYLSSDASNASPTTQSLESSNDDGKKKTKKSKLVDEVNSVRALLDELAARLRGIDHAGAHLEVKVIDVEKLLKCLDERITDMEENWERRLRMAEIRADIAERRAVLAEKHVDQLEKMVDAKIANAVTRILYELKSKEELANMQHGFLLTLYTKLAQEPAATKDEGRNPCC